MKMKSVKIVLAIAVTFFVFGTPLYAQGTDSRIGSIARERNEHAAAPATAISKEEAQKNIRRGVALIPPLSAMLMIQPVSSSVHIRRMKGMIARKLHTADWLWTQRSTKSL